MPKHVQETHMTHCTCSDKRTSHAFAFKVDGCTELVMLQQPAQTCQAIVSHQVYGKQTGWKALMLYIRSRLQPLPAYLFSACSQHSALSQLHSGSKSPNGHELQCPDCLGKACSVFLTVGASITCIANLLVQILDACGLDTCAACSLVRSSGQYNINCCLTWVPGKLQMCYVWVLQCNISLSNCNKMGMSIC